MSQPSFDQWLSERRHELRTRYGNEHLGPLRIEEFEVWLRDEYKAEMAKADDPNGERT